MHSDFLMNLFYKNSDAFGNVRQLIIDNLSFHGVRQILQEGLWLLMKWVRVASYIYTCGYLKGVGPTLVGQLTIYCWRVD